MKRNCLLVLLAMLLGLCGCTGSAGKLNDTPSQNTEECAFLATILEKRGTTVLVQPVEGEDELRSSDQISFSTKNLEDIGATVGSTVEITYSGEIMESYPAQIVVTDWRRITDLRQCEYTNFWLDQETAQRYDNNVSNPMVITDIYSNCFFAYPSIPMPYMVKMNGKLSDQWCVGDQVSVTYENAWYDQGNSRVEADFITVEASDWEPEPGVAYKPVIYLYPQEDTQVSVRLELDGKLTCTYPDYQKGWQVTAAPDGTLRDAEGQTYNYLYWEGKLNTQYDLSQGFCVKGEDTAAFLEDALAKLGLNRREANEFIVYWLPLMQENPYNIISFQTERYTDAARLKVEPAPDTLIRVFMAWQAAEEPIQLPPQELSAPQRNGFTVVEWGGGEIV